MLIDDANVALRRLIKLDAVKSGAKESQSLEYILRELSVMSDNISKLADWFVLMSNSGASISMTPKFAEISGDVQAVQKKFVANPQVDALKRGNVWGSLQNKLATFIDTAKTAQKDDWAKYFDMYFSPAQTPDQRTLTLIGTPQNQKSLKLYRELYASLVVHRKTPPVCADTLADIIQLSQKIKGISFQDDVPECIRTFFSAIENNSAGLNMLTPDVLKWLDDNNLIERYVIRPRL